MAFSAIDRGRLARPVRFVGALGFLAFISLTSDIFFLDRHDSLTIPLAEMLAIVILSAPLLYYYIYRPVSEMSEESKRLAHDAMVQAKRYSASFQLATVGKAHIGTDGRVIEANPAMAAMLGFTLEEMRGKDIINGLTCRDYQDALHHRLEEMLSGNSTNIEFETCFAQKNGKKVWVEADISLIRGESGLPLHFISQFQNITARKQAIKETLYIKRLLEATFANLHDAVIVVSLPDRTIEMTNSAVERIFGYNAKEMTGQSTRLLYSSEDDYEAFGKKMQEALECEKVFQTEYPMTRKDGGPFPAELHITKIDPANEWENPRLVGVVRDLSERNRSAQELDEMRSRIESVAQAVTDAMVVLDTKGRILTWSPSASGMFGFSAEEAENHNLSLILPQAEELIADADYRSINTGKEITLPLYATRKDGSEIPVELNIAPWEIRGRDYLTVIIKDLSALNEAKEKAIRSYQSLREAHEKLQKAYTTMAEKEKLVSIGTLASGVAHEILNPLNIISTIVQTMQLDDWPEDAEENFREIRNQVVRATKITNNLRMFSHKGKNVFEEVDLIELAAKTLSLVEHDLKVRNIDVTMDYHPEIPLIKADKDKLAQVLLNLLNNARDALDGRKNGKLKISVTPSESGITLMVQDNGPGIPEEIQSKIFEHFFTTKDPEKGTGLGLSVVYNIIKEHGGEIDVRGSKKKGATFVISLPKEPPAPQVSQEPLIAASA